MKVLAVVLGIVGIIIIGCADWRIAIGVFLALWGNNLGLDSAGRLKRG